LLKKEHDLQLLTNENINYKNIFKDSNITEVLTDLNKALKDFEKVFDFSFSNRRYNFFNRESL
jgi:hypothetical protein